MPKSNGASQTFILCRGHRGAGIWPGRASRDFHIETGIIDNEGSLGHILVRLEEREKEAHDSFLLLMFQEKGKIHGDQIPFRVGEASRSG